MKALVYYGPHDLRVEERPKPKPGPGDVTVKVILSTICGSELHMLHGLLPVEKGLILGHEPVGIVEEIGEGVKGFEVGDRVAVSCITRCGHCYYCQKGLYFNCEKGGFQMGFHMNGSHAQYMRVPYAELALYKIPDELKTEEVIFVTDALSTGYKGAEMGRIEPGDTVVIYGSGPIGICALVCAKLWNPESVILVDLLPERLEFAKKMGADVVINPNDHDPIEVVKELTHGRGADVAIEAVGVPQTFTWTCESLRNGGHISVLGVFDRPTEIPIQKLINRSPEIRIGSLTTANIPQLINLIAKRKIDLSSLLTHAFPLDQAAEAFDVFDKRRGGAMKVGLRPQVEI
jgi:alcohol dehydrogenase